MIRTHKWGDRWGIPGGKIEQGEGALDAIKREIREETALEIGKIEFVIAQDCMNSEEFQSEQHFVLLNYMAHRKAGEVVLNEEAEKFRWCHLEEALELDLNTPTRILLEACKHKI